MQLVQPSEPEGLGVQPEGDVGVAILVQSVICYDIVILKPPCDVEELRVGVEQLDGHVHLDVGLGIGVHGVNELFKAATGEPAVEGEDDLIVW